MTRQEILKSAKPILFNTDMVRAILDGRKMVTRRVIKRNVDAILNSPYHNEHPEVEDKQIIRKLCMPPYRPGDILYVRETWNICNMCADGNTIVFIYKANKSEEESAMEVKVSDELYDKYERSMAENNPEWRPSIYMPKEAARIFLKVTNVRVERLQDIDDEQAKEEGANWRNGKNVGFEEKMRRSAVERFAEIWNSNIKKSDLDRYGWDANPWVWVIEFEVIQADE